MTRIILWSALFVFCATAATLPASAESKKGVLGFFNRDDSSPVHMQSNISGTASGEDAQPISLGKPPEKMARYEDSPIHEERRLAHQVFDQWNANELAKANASTEALMAQFRAQSQLNEQMARQEQAEQIARARSRTGSAAAQAAAQQNVQQVRSSIPAVAPVAAPPVEEPKEVTPAKPKREHKPRHFFNRTE